MTQASETDDLFSDAYRDLLAPYLGVGEPRVEPYPAAREVGEKLVRCLWFDQYFDGDSLRTEDGRKVTVISPGFWNEGSGPDFQNAEIRFEEEAPVRGHVEVHLLASDYGRHQHGGDPAYDSVVLHAVFTNDLGTAYLETAGRRVPQVALDRHLTADLAEVLSALDLELPRAVMPGNTGPCCAALRQRGRDETWIGRFLDLAGDARVLGKARQYADMLAGSTPDQCLYFGLMDALGYKGNRRPFRRLAECVPVTDLRRLLPEDRDLEERIRIAEGILFGAAGLLPGEVEARHWDEETAAYVQALREAWGPVQHEFGERRVERGVWQFGKTRPVNYPTRRVAAAARLTARYAHAGLSRTVIETLERAGGDPQPRRRARAALRNIQDLFLDVAGGYWGSRCRFGARTLASPTRLLGAERTQSMVMNVIIPAMVAVAQDEGNESLERMLHGVYSSLGRMGENSVTRYMQARLFADPGAARRVVTTARRQQGLFQLYHDFCESHENTCERCAFLSLARQETVPC